MADGIEPVTGESEAKDLDTRLAPGSLVALEWAGIMPFYMRQEVLDIFGLSDKTITSSDRFPGSPMGRGITPEFLVSRNPDIVIYSGRIYHNG